MTVCINDELTGEKQKNLKKATAKLHKYKKYI